jgi:hypothetical protein
MTSFGWGQRQCLGIHLTQDETIVDCGALAWCFTLKAKTDPTSGRDKPVPLDKSNSLLIIKPDPFEMAFEPRSEERKDEALRLWEEADMGDQQERAEVSKGAMLSRLPKLEVSMPPDEGVLDETVREEVAIEISPISPLTDCDGSNLQLLRDRH